MRPSLRLRAATFEYSIPIPSEKRPIPFSQRLENPLPLETARLSSCGRGRLKFLKNNRSIRLWVQVALHLRNRRDFGEANLKEVKTMHKIKLTVAVLSAVVLGAGALRAATTDAATCCKPGMTCCKSGAVCCKK